MEILIGKKIDGKHRVPHPGPTFYPKDQHQTHARTFPAKAFLKILAPHIDGQFLKIVKPRPADRDNGSVGKNKASLNPPETITALEAKFLQT